MSLKFLLSSQCPKSSSSTHTSRGNRRERTTQKSPEIASHNITLHFPKKRERERALARDSSSKRTVASSGPTRRKAASSSSSSSSSATTSSVPIRRASSQSEVDYPFWQQNWFIGFLFLMALGFFALALFLFLGLDSEDGYASYATASSSSEGVEVWSVFLILLIYMWEMLASFCLVAGKVWENKWIIKASVWLTRKIMIKELTVRSKLGFCELNYQN